MPPLLRAAPACRKAGRARSAPARQAAATPARKTPDSTTSHETRAARARLPGREIIRAAGLSIRWNDIRGTNAARDVLDSSAVRARRAELPLARRSRCESLSDIRSLEKIRLALRSGGNCPSPALGTRNQATCQSRDDSSISPQPFDRSPGRKLSTRPGHDNKRDRAGSNRSLTILARRQSCGPKFPGVRLGSFHRDPVDLDVNLPCGPFTGSAQVHGRRAKSRRVKPRRSIQELSHLPRRSCCLARLFHLAFSVLTDLCWPRTMLRMPSESTELQKTATAACLSACCGFSWPSCTDPCEGLRRKGNRLSGAGLGFCSARSMALPTIHLNYNPAGRHCLRPQPPTGFLES